MFTGIIAEQGHVVSVDRDGDTSATIRLHAPGTTEGLALGGSIAVNGVCLTATDTAPDGFSAEAMNQTLRVSSLGPLQPGDRVNLELPLRAGDRLGGHVVQGHVDGTAEVVSVEGDGFARRLRAEIDSGLARYLVERGSVALEGVSLTVSGVGDSWLEVSLVPETLERTTLGEAKIGDRLNVELDVLAKHVERLMQPSGRKKGD